jgi:hypothetical protein
MSVDQAGRPKIGFTGQAYQLQIPEWLRSIEAAGGNRGKGVVSYGYPPGPGRLGCPPSDWHCDVGRFRECGTPAQDLETAPAGRYIRAQHMADLVRSRPTCAIEHAPREFPGCLRATGTTGAPHPLGRAAYCRLHFTPLGPWLAALGQSWPRQLRHRSVL